MSDAKSLCSKPFSYREGFSIDKDSLTFEGKCVLHAGLTLSVLERSALIKKIDGTSKETKEVEKECVVAGSRTKKVNPIHFRWTAPLKSHHGLNNIKGCIIKPSTHLICMKAKLETNYKYHSEPKTSLMYTESYSSMPVEISCVMYKLHTFMCEKYLK